MEVAVEVIMPKQGLLMTEGTITRWIKNEGDKVEKGEPLFEMETDKLAIEIDAPESGTLLKIIKGVGEVVPITEVIGIIGEPGEDISKMPIMAGADTAEGPVADTAPEMAEAFPETGTAAESADVFPETEMVLEASDVFSKGDITAEAAVTSHGKAAAGELVDIINDTGNEGKESRVFITPRAKMTAGARGIEYRNIKGTGPKGLIIERDVQAFADSDIEVGKEGKDRQAVKTDLIAVAVTGRVSDTGPGALKSADKAKGVEIQARIGATEISRGERLVKLTGMRKVIADNMMKSLHGMAQANHRMKVDMTETVRLREKFKSNNKKVTYTDILVKVVSRALMDFPALNSSLTEEGILIRDYVNMGIAVSVEDGLFVPVIKNADLMGLDEISAASSQLAEKARKGGLSPDDYTGGTFTITNLGMYDIDEFTAIINPPESAILAVGKINKEAVIENDNIVVRPIMILSLTYDHRIIDGVLAAQFLQRIKLILQNLYLLL